MKLDAEKRNSLPKSEFGMPGSRKFPMPDKNHARNALARASEMEHEGRISASEKEKIDSKAHRMLGEEHEDGGTVHHVHEHHHLHEHVHEHEHDHQHEHMHEDGGMKRRFPRYR